MKEHSAGTGSAHPASAELTNRFALAEVEDTIQSRFVRIAATYPDRFAVVSRQAKLTYAELDETSNAVSSAIVSVSGGGPKPVAVIMPQGVQATVAIVGVLKAGSFYVPLDLDLPDEWARGLLSDVAPEVLLTNAESIAHVTSLVPGEVRVLDVAEITSKAGNHAGHAADGAANQDASRDSSSGLEGGNVGSGNPDDRAYVYFTSGTTGRPKGVMDTHRNVLHNVMRYTNALSIGPDDRLTLLQSIGFSGSVSSLFCGLLNGAAVYPIDMHRETAASLADWIRENSLTIYHSVPSIFRSITGESRTYPSVRIVRLEGDAASVRDLARFRDSFIRGSRLVNGLGLTETGIVCQYSMDHDTRLLSDLMPVGYPCEGMSVEVVGEDQRPLSAGQVGEIAVTSGYLAAGYWKQPERTDEAFVPLPGEDGIRMYRTGDLGRIASDGALEHLGRTDGRIRLGGHWIEPSVIESLLVEIPGVSEAVVSLKADASDYQRLVAYMVRVAADRDTGGAGATESVREADIRRRLKETFPAWVVPSRFVFLKRLPLTSNGKVDRDALPSPGRSRPDLEVELVRPVGSLQMRLSEIWSDVLAIDGIGIRDDFFDLGGDSLQAMTMLGRVEEVLNRRLSPDVLLTGATIEHLADALVERESELHVPVVALQTEGAGRPFFFLHGDYLSGGFYCLELARRMGAERPFYAVRPSGLGGEVLPNTYEGMAMQHIGAIKAVQPEGPYLLGGLCNGGLAAFEVARKLQQHGEQVSMLVMVDSTAINLEFDKLRRRLEMLRWMGLGRKELDWLFLRLRAIALDVDDGSFLTGIRLFVQRLWRKARRVALNRGDGGNATSLLETESDTLPTTVTEHWEKYRALYQRIDNLYIPGSYSGRVALLWPEEKADESVDEARAVWERVCPQIEVREVPGDMVTSHTRYIADLADAIRQCLVGA